ARAPAATRAAAGARVLVIDDNADAADSLVFLLRGQGYEVEVARSGPEAVERARAFRPDAALLDIGLPGFDGYEVARRLRREHPRELVLVALTGYGTPEDRRLAESAGFDAHLVKPVASPKLFALLGRALAARSGA
ncbi:MAG: hypothetical protein DCC71_25855, partial [Proteobacteria bacterium]